MMMEEGKQVLIHSSVDLGFNDKAKEMLDLNPSLVFLVVNGNPSTLLQTFMLVFQWANAILFSFTLLVGNMNPLFHFLCPFL